MLARLALVCAPALACAGPAPAPSPTAPSAAAPSATKPIHCPAAVPLNVSGPDDPLEVAGTPVGEMAILPVTRWQPVGGEVQFAISGVEAAPEHVRVDFAWADKVDAPDAQPARSSAGSSAGSAAHATERHCFRSNAVRLVPSGPAPAGDPAYFYAATVPAGLRDRASWIEGSSHWTWFNIVPQAAMFVSADIPGGDARPATPTVLVRPVGISTPWIALLAALLLLGSGWLLLYRWARQMAIQGGPLLRIISTPDGSASLSQFQILMWTCVIGAGTTYVMLLSGNLIDIPDTTLALLGVTGLALVGSRLITNLDGTPQRASVPGAVTDLRLSGGATGTLMVLTWTGPADTAQPFGYSVQQQASGTGIWTEIAAGVAGPPYAVLGLEPGRTYNFQVFAVNRAGAGPAGVLLGQRTAENADPALAPPMLAQVTGIAATANADGTMRVTWSDITPAPEGYTLQYRVAGTQPWATFDTAMSAPATVTGLDGSTLYQFQVFATSGGVAGPPSAIASARTAARLPRWSDLVRATDRDAEIDLGRLQMLLFTTIAAIFTGLTLIETGHIPDIPGGELGLVGLSNGIYLSHKAIGRRR